LRFVPINRVPFSAGRGGPSTSNLEGKIVTCRAHGWRYDVTTGFVAHVPNYAVATYPVKVVDGKIMVALS
jgi:nitrite reductase/ring-hydroxylating ferredoxin subunit